MVSKEAIKNVLRKKVGTYVSKSDGDESCYKEVIDALCHNKSIEMYGYTFFFAEVTLYEA